MLADAVNRDIPYKDELIVVRLKGGDEVLARVLVEPGENLGVHARNACRRCPEPFAFGVLSYSQEDLPDGGFDPAQIDSYGTCPLYRRIQGRFR